MWFFTFFLIKHKADRVSCGFLLYNSHAQTLQASILANILMGGTAGSKMNLKTKIKVYQKVINELGNRFEGAEEFILNRIKELYSEHGISTKEVRLYIFLCLLCYVQSLERVFLALE